MFRNFLRNGNYIMSHMRTAQVFHSKHGDVVIEVPLFFEKGLYYKDIYIDDDKLILHCKCRPEADPQGKMPSRSDAVVDLERISNRGCCEKK